MKKNKSQILGIFGENAASEYLKSLGFHILSRNFRTKYGEIDIVALDKETLVFVEVKTRKSNRYGSAEESITPEKMKRLISAANYYKLLRPDLSNPMRIDVVCIYISPVDTIEKVTLYKNISN